MIQGVCVRSKGADALDGLGRVVRAGTGALLPFMVLLIGSATAALSHGPTCSVTYCISIRETISAGSGAFVQPAVALISVIQVSFAVAVAFPSLVVLVALRRQAPLSGLKVLAHLRSLECAPSHSHWSRAATFWLPIESISAGRLTSKMQRAPNFFGPGRP